MDNNIAIEVKNLTKIYPIYNDKSDRLKESLSLTRKKYHKDFYALNDVSFTINKGEVFGIVGQNGSGKSTILKIITGVLSQTSGDVIVNGKISALLELGAGFNQEMTGIENIYLNGTIMGYTKEEMDVKIPQIVEFADIGDFVNQPVKMYSSGMFARLAFAVAINVEPDILIVDEALSVGDMRFQIKCMDHMKKMMEGGTTILFVSHSIEQVNRFCTKAIWLNNGNLKLSGVATSVTSEYENYLIYGQNISEHEANASEEQNLSQVEMILPEDKSILALIKNVSINSNSFNLFDKLEVTIEYEVYTEKIENFLIGAAIYTPKREYIFGPNTHLEGEHVYSTYGKHVVRYTIPKLPIIKGRYDIDVGIFADKGMINIDYKESVVSFEMNNNYISEGLLYMENCWEVLC